MSPLWASSSLCGKKNTSQSFRGFKWNNVCNEFGYTSHTAGKSYIVTINSHFQCQLNCSSLKSSSWASLVAQWLRIYLPMQGTRVRALVWEDPTCRRATRPVCHNCWACASGACAPQQERPRIVRGPRTAMKRGPHLLQLEKALPQKRRPNTAKNK